MSSRLAEKQRRRAEREARERELAARERRARRLRLTGAAVAAAVLLAGGAALIALAAGSDEELPAGASQPFGQHYEGLEQRRVAAGVATMDAPTGTEHTHQQLSVWVNGRQIDVPANLGIDPRRPPAQMAALHTHEEPGLIHNEGQANPTLGQFFAVWGVPFSKNRLGPNRATGDRVVQMWVDGKPSQAWGSLKLADGQDIQIAFGPERRTPPAD